MKASKSMRRGVRSSRAVLPKVIIMTMAVTMAMGACSKPQNSAQEDDLLDAVVKRGTINVGVCLTLAPYGFYDKSNTKVGFDIDIAERMAKELGVKLNLVEVQNKTRIPSVTSGQVDVVMCDITGTPERAKTINFTRPYVAAGIGVAVPTSSTIKTFDDLAGKEVGVTKGGLAGDVLSKKYPSAKIQTFDDTATGVLALRKGQVEAFADNKSGLVLRQTGEADYRVLPGTPAPLNYNSFGVKKGQFNWLVWQNNFITTMVVRGEIDALYTKWFKRAPEFSVNEFASANTPSP